MFPFFVSVGVKKPAVSRSVLSACERVHVALLSLLSFLLLPLSHAHHRALTLLLGPLFVLLPAFGHITSGQFYICAGL